MVRISSFSRFSSMVQVNWDSVNMHKWSEVKERLMKHPVTMVK